MRTLRDVWDYQVASRPDREFLVWEDPDTGVVKSYTYAQMNERSHRAANLLRSRGVRPGDRVMVQLGNQVAFIDLFLACSHIGAVLVPLDPGATRCERNKILRAATPVLIVTSESTDLPTGWEASQMICLADYSALCAAQEPYCEGAEVTSSSLIEVMFTSGTTAAPKGAMMTHANVVFSGEYVMWELAMTPDDRYLTTMAATHVNLQLSALAPVIVAGATLVLVKRYSATRFWGQVKAHRATLVQGMAMIVRTLLAQPIEPGERDHHLRMMHYFLPLTNEERAAFIERYGVGLLNNYGSTECLVGVLTDPPTGENRWPSVGKAGPGYEVRIVLPNGNLAAPGEQGEIQIRGTLGISLMAGYLNAPELTSQAIDPDGWYRTGDCGYIDDDGWVYFVDRFVDLIKRGGENISALEVEDVLLRHPGVAEVAVVGVADPVRDQAVKAVVVPKEGVQVDAESLHELAAHNLAPFKVPTLFEFRRSLPRGEYGKVLKTLLASPSTDCEDENEGVVTQ